MIQRTVSQVNSVVSNVSVGHFGGGEGSTRGGAPKVKRSKSAKKDEHHTLEFPRRSEAGIINDLRVQVRGLKSDVERLSEENMQLAAKLKMREEQLRDATEILDLQRVAWHDMERASARREEAAASSARDEDRSQGTPAISAGSSLPTSRPTTAQTAPAGRRPLSARPSASRPQSAQVPHPPENRVDKSQGGGWLESEAEQKQQWQGGVAAQRPLTARQAELPKTTPRMARPNTARPALGAMNNKVARDKAPVPPALPTAGIFEQFPQDAIDRKGNLSFGMFAARSMLSGREASRTIKNISEQSASFESLGNFLQCAWIEVKNGTASEPAPNFFRLAVCCSIFDKICSVVGAYSGLLLDLRRELYSCIFKGYDPDIVKPVTLEDYAQLLPYFAEFKRLESERTNAKRMIERVAKLQGAARKSFESLM